MKFIPTDIAFKWHILASTRWRQNLVTVIIINECNTLFLDHWSYCESAMKLFPDFRDHFVYAPRQWKTALQFNVVSHWLGACTKMIPVIWVFSGNQYMTTFHSNRAHIRIMQLSVVVHVHMLVEDVIRSISMLSLSAVSHPMYRLIVDSPIERYHRHKTNAKKPSKPNTVCQCFVCWPTATFQTWWLDGAANNWG